MHYKSFFVCLLLWQFYSIIWIKLLNKNLFFFLQMNLQSCHTESLFHPDRQICSQHAWLQNLRFPVCAGLPGPFKGSYGAQGLRMLHELRCEGQPDAPHHLVPQQRQPQHQHQLPNLQHLWRVLHPYPKGAAKRHGRVQHYRWEPTGQGWELHQALCSRLVNLKKNLSPLKM